jgi:hypothetical protein
MGINNRPVGTAATAGFYGEGYLADYNYIDGQALTPTSFGQFDGNNYWVPKTYSGTYGTAGFHLDFSDSLQPSQQILLVTVTTGLLKISV